MSTKRKDWRGEAEELGRTVESLLKAAGQYRDRINALEKRLADREALLRHVQGQMAPAGRLFATCRTTCEVVESVSTHSNAMSAAALRDVARQLREVMEICRKADLG